MRSLQPPDIIWIHWRVYNSIVNTSKQVLFLPASDVYVRSFLHLLYTLIKLYYTKTLSDQASSLAPIEFFSSGGQESWRLFEVQQQTFNNGKEYLKNFHTHTHTHTHTQTESLCCIAEINYCKSTIVQY